MFPLISQAELIGLSSEPSGHSLVGSGTIYHGKSVRESSQFQHLAQGSASFSFWGLKEDANVKSILVIQMAAVNTKGRIHGARHSLHAHIPSILTLALMR